MKYLIILLLVSFNAQAWYAEAAIGINATETGPEIVLPAPFAKYAIGIENKDGWSIELEHISSIPYKEKDHGLNILWFQKRIHF